MTDRPVPDLVTELLGRQVPPQPWPEGDGLPWSAPAFSRRMLREHLSQDHDLASRRHEAIVRHVGFLESRLDRGRTLDVLDLACGPGLYLHALARRGHRGHGIDFAPAAIAHARRVASEESLDVTFEEADLREVSLGTDFDVALLLYGQVNVFPRRVASDLLQRARRSLRPGGCLVLEPQTDAAVRGPARSTTEWQVLERGLFADEPHLLLHERWWDEPSRTSTERWWVSTGSGRLERYGQSTCAYAADEWPARLRDAGFAGVETYPSLDGEPADDGLSVVVATTASSS